MNFQNNIDFYGQYVGICSVPEKFEDIKALGDQTQSYLSPTIRQIERWRYA